VLSYQGAEYDWLLTASAVGEDATHPDLLSRPEWLCDTIAEALRALHEMPVTDCPVPCRMDEYFATVEEGYACGRFDAALFPSRVAPARAEEAYALFLIGREMLSDRVLLHGDYCLPNIILHNDAVSAFIDVGNGGVGDRHIDLFWGVWTLEYNLKTPRYGARFLDAYGRDAVNLDLLRVVAAAECFG
jgi:kanamycin kinase